MKDYKNQELPEDDLTMTDVIVSALLFAVIFSLCILPSSRAIWGALLALHQQ